MEKVLNPKEDLKIAGVITEEVGTPKNDGTRGSGLYKVPLRLTGVPSAEWARLFVQTWDHPPQFTSMHRPGIASVIGDQVVLNGTTMEELERYHLQTLRIVMEKVNAEYQQLLDQQEQKAAGQAAETVDHKSRVSDVASRLTFE